MLPPGTKSWTRGTVLPSSPPCHRGSSALRSRSTWSSESLYQDDPAQTTPSCRWCLTLTSTARTRTTPASSPTWTPAARRGTTATSTAARPPSSAPTARSSRRPSSSATGGSTCGATSASSCTLSTRGSTGGPRSTPPGRTESSPSSCWRTSSCDRSVIMREFTPQGWTWRRHEKDLLTLLCFS